MREEARRCRRAGPDSETPTRIVNGASRPSRHRGVHLSRTGSRFLCFRRSIYHPTWAEESRLTAGVPDAVQCKGLRGDGGRPADGCAVSSMAASLRSPAEGGQAQGDPDAGIVIAGIILCLLRSGGTLAAGPDNRSLPGIAAETVADDLQAIIEANRTFDTIHVTAREACPLTGPCGDCVRVGRKQDGRSVPDRVSQCLSKMATFSP